ncbi:MAG: isochorismatase family protein [Treponema sp.]|nr:isochorismatase family protein [Treponema sp.]
MKGDLLLIIDMQNVYAKGGAWECMDTEGAAQNILRIVQSGAADSAIITKFIADKKPRGVWKDYNQKYKEINEDKNANELLPQIAALAGRFPVYEKSKYSSLCVKKIRKSCLKAKRVVVTGVVDDCCVLATVFELIDAGVYTVYITDATSGLDKPKAAATELTLSGLSPLHVKLMTTDEYLAEKDSRVGARE